MITIRISNAIEAMKSDIVRTTTIFQDNIPESANNWYYYISIYANDYTSLIHASRLMEALNVYAKAITIIPITYKTCKFDCFYVTSVFNNIHSTSLYNIDTISIIESDDVIDGDFYISIIRENKSTKLMDIMTYNSLKSYCKE